MKESEWEYGPAVIKLDSAKRFSVFYEGEKNGKSYDTWDAATKAVDDREKRESTANRIKIKVPVFLGDAKRTKRLITGIHGGHGGYLSSPPLDKHGSSAYLDHPLVHRLMDKLDSAKKAFDAAGEAVRPFALESSDWKRKEMGLTSAEGIQKWYEQKARKADAAYESIIKEEGNNGA